MTALVGRRALSTLKATITPTTTSTGRIRMSSADLPEAFRPPVNRTMRVLDRSFFQKTVSLSAATVFDQKNLSSTRGTLQKSGDILAIWPIKTMRDDGTLP